MHIHRTHRTHGNLIRLIDTDWTVYIYPTHCMDQNEWMNEINKFNSRSFLAWFSFASLLVRLVVYSFARWISRFVDYFSHSISFFSVACLINSISFRFISWFFVLKYFCVCLVKTFCVVWSETKKKKIHTKFNWLNKCAIAYRFRIIIIFRWSKSISYM